MHGLVLISALVFIPAPGEQSPVLTPEPIRCAPCTLEKLSACPAAPSGCRELVKEQGCGCCMSCALPEGTLCGVYTAHCGTGLRCMPRADDPHPLHSLTHGQAVCTVDHTVQGASLLPVSSAEIMFAEKLHSVMMNYNHLLPEEASDHDFSLHHLLGLDKAGDPEAHKSIKAKANHIQRILVELVRRQITQVQALTIHLVRQAPDHMTSSNRPKRVTYPCNKGTSIIPWL